MRYFILKYKHIYIHMCIYAYVGMYVYISPHWKTKSKTMNKSVAMILWKKCLYVASKGIKTPWLSRKESRLLGKMVDSSSQAGNMLDESGKFCHIRQKGSYQRLWGPYQKEWGNHLKRLLLGQS